MKRITGLFICAMLLLTVNVFAGGEGEDGGATAKLTVYNYRDKTAPGAEGTDIVYDKFREANPNVELEVEELFNEPYHQKLQAMAASDQLPDLFYVWPGARTGYVTGAGKAQDLYPYLGDKKDMFAAMAVAPQGANGELWEIADTVTTCHVMFTNNRLLDELGLTFPETYDELMAQKDTIVAAGYVPIAMANKDGWEMQSCFLSALVERTGGLDWYDRAIVGDGAGYADAEFVAALNIIKELTDNEMFPAGINQMDYPQGTQMFMSEEAVYYIDGDWKAGELQEGLTEEQKSYVTFETFPDVPNQKGVSGSTAAVPGTGVAMNANLEGAQADLAWSFVWHWAGPVGSQVRYEYGQLPTYKLDINYDELDPMLQELNRHQTTSALGYVLDNKHDQEAFDVLHTALQEMMFGNKTPVEVANEWEAWLAENDSKRGN